MKEEEIVGAYEEIVRDQIMHFLAGHDKELVFYFKGKRKSRGFYVKQSHNLINISTGYLGCCLDYRGQQWKEGSS